MTFRYFLSFIVIIFASSATLFAEPWEVRAEYEEESSFNRIREYFGGGERYRYKLVLRSRGDDRSGVYWKLQRPRRQAAIAAGSKFILEYYREKSGTPVKHVFPVREEMRRREVYLGVTGADWESSEVGPVAWRIQLLDADGKLVAQQQSFLWEYPAP